MITENTTNDATPNPTSARMRSMQTHVLHSLYAMAIGPISLALYGALLEMAWAPQFSCWVSRRRLADMMGRLDGRVVDRAAAKLVAAGLITKQARTSSDGDKMSNLWTLTPIWYQFDEAIATDKMKYRGEARVVDAGTPMPSDCVLDDEAVAPEMELVLC